MKKLTRQEKITKEFFNQAADEWFGRTYDPRGEYLKFPVNRLRKDVALNEIKQLGLKGGVLDLGCGTGQMVIDLLKMGYRASGIDIASKMIERAKVNLAKEKIRKDKRGQIFRVGHFADSSTKEKYDIVTALGLLEYLDNDQELFSALKNLVIRGGYAFVECRNKFFNLFTGNKYTLFSCKAGEFPYLTEAISDIEKFSPVSAGRIPEIQAQICKEINSFLKIAVNNKFWHKKQTFQYTKYPETMMRRQHIPQELDLAAERYGFRLDYVVYYHLHPYLPRYEKIFPQIYNKISELMTPLGRTSAGASLGSAFIGVLRKK